MKQVGVWEKFMCQGTAGLGAQGSLGLPTPLMATNVNLKRQEPKAASNHADVEDALPWCGSGKKPAP